MLVFKSLRNQLYLMMKFKKKNKVYNSNPNNKWFKTVLSNSYTKKVPKFINSIMRINIHKMKRVSINNS